MGLAVLPHLEFIIERRKQVVDFYNNELNFSHLAKLKIRPLTRWNYSYYPVLFSDEQRLLEVDAELRKNEITGRRYFYPSLNTLQFIDGKTCPVSEDVSKRIMCLPLYPDLNENQLRKITSVINAVLNA